MFQGFLSDLLKKANRPYDEPKLQEYTQTIVSDNTARLLGVGGMGPETPRSFSCRCLILEVPPSSKCKLIVPLVLRGAR